MKKTKKQLINVESLKDQLTSNLICNFFKSWIKKNPMWFETENQKKRKLNFFFIKSILYVINVKKYYHLRSSK